MSFYTRSPQYDVYSDGRSRWNVCGYFPVVGSVTGTARIALGVLDLIAPRILNNISMQIAILNIGRGLAENGALIAITAAHQLEVPLHYGEITALFLSVSALLALYDQIPKPRLI